MSITRGDIFYADLSPVVGSEQGGYRPVLILQNNKGNKFSTTVIVAPISSKVQKNKIPTHVLIDNDQLEKKSIVLLEQIRTIDKKRIFDKVGCVSAEKMELINQAIKTSLDIK
ncbi:MULTISPECIES: type II toxin-antitoxin system PemK/MazF family toxin [Beduini]|uniref:type II toxin-antitoxin system PemK/MazF family toxin n=1 Tax=Beduini TaxID=1922299 RepID=UPI00059AA307|nr:type II toxin-antitoxin system PemK/MazF family toxin [Beduini massiliensis]